MAGFEVYVRSIRFKGNVAGQNHPVTVVIVRGSRDVFRSAAPRASLQMSYPYPQRTHILRPLGLKTLLCKAFGLFGC